MTDANLLLGRLSERGLLGGEMPLDLSRARAALQPIAQALDMSVEQAAWAVIRLAGSNMERAVRAVTLQRGYDPRRFTLVAFGGAGPLHAAELAGGLGVRLVLVPPHPGVMAALGLTVPDLRRDFDRTVLLPLADQSETRFEESFEVLESGAGEALSQEELGGFGEMALSRAVDVRYVGQSFELRLAYATPIRRLREAFDRAHRDRYGHASPSHAVEVVNLRVRATAPRLEQPRLVPDWPEDGGRTGRREVWFGSTIGVANLRSLQSTTLWRPSLSPGTVIEGPAVVEQYDSATLVPPNWSATVDERFNLLLTRR